MKKAIINITAITFAILFAAPNVSLADPYTDPWGAVEAGQCVVRSAAASGSFSLSMALGKYNNATVEERWRECKNKINFSISSANVVHVSGTLSLTQTRGSGLVIDGNNASTSQNVELNTTFADGPVFQIESSGNGGTVTIKNFVVSSNDFNNPFVECSNATTVVLENITISNTPAEAMTFVGCRNVTVTGLKFTAGTQNFAEVLDLTTTSQLDTAAIFVDGAINARVTVDSYIGSSQTSQTLGGVFLAIQNTRTAEVTVSSVSNLASQVAVFLSGESDESPLILDKLNVTATAVQNGVVLNYVKQGATAPVLKLTGQPSHNGVGLLLNNRAIDLRFSSTTSVSQFGGNGIEIRDASDNNVFDGVLVERNTGNGILVTDNARGIQIKNAKVINNGVCGVVLNSAYHTVLNGATLDLHQNGATGCPVKIDSNSQAKFYNGSEVILVPTSDHSMLLDVDQSLVGSGGSSAEVLELHRLTRGANNPSATTSTGTGKKGKTGKKGGLTKKPNPGSTGAVASGDLPGSDNAPSYIGGFNLADLPDPVNRNVGDYYFTIFTTQGGEVLAYWQGKILGSGSLSDLTCYTDPATGQKYRVYSQTADGTYPDLDADGLPDFGPEGSETGEDKNRNCLVDAGETSPDTADTDGDGLNDYLESKSGSATDPLDNDSDDDNLLDGLEDLNKSGAFEQEYCVTDASSPQYGWCETDPAKADTDGDTLGDERERALGTNPNAKNTDGDDTPDNLDECPLLHPDDGECYYANCAAGVALPGEQDADEDGVRDDDEDTNNNCVRDPSETDANDADSDDDGIADGVEDYNRNGVYEPTVDKETNPLSTDTDGDGITDGKEDKSFDGEIDYSAGETDPRLTDSDADTLGDGVEDKNKDGSVDPGETSAGKADSEGDGQNDSVDQCPWSIKPGCVVYYCDVSGFDQDTDGDGENDKEEDYNGDCLHTPKDKEPHPLKKDTDEDGLDDGLEACYETNPNVKDTDGDGRSDFDEVKSSGLTCTAMYNLGSTNPLRAEYGSCSLNRRGATSGALLTIILMTMAVIPMVVIRRKKEVDQ